MSTVLQFVRTLEARPVAEPIAGLAIRTFAGPQDIAPWLALRQKAFSRQSVGVRAWSEVDFAAEFLHKPWWNGQRMWIAEPAGAFELLPRVFAGSVTCALRGEGPTARPAVHWLAVHPNYRNRGLGRLLLTTLEASCWDAGQTTIVLETHAAWTSAVRLYQSLGYQLDQH